MKKAAFGIMESDTGNIGLHIQLIGEDHDDHLKGVDEDLDRIIEKNDLDESSECMFDYIGDLTNIDEIKSNLEKDGLEYDPRLDEYANPGY
jgi:hypothetical protein